MSIARAFTKRSKRTEVLTPSPMPVRPGTVKNLTGKEVTSKMISSPALISTTNTLALSAPHVQSIRALRSKASSISSTSSASSADDSDKSSTRSRSRDTHLTDASSIENSPTASPGTQHAETFFASKSRRSEQSIRRSVSSVDIRSKVQPPGASPEVPRRAPSHSKKAHEMLARKRSLQQMSSHARGQSASSVLSSDQRDARTSLETSTASTTTELPPAHPFGKELDQLVEVAEEFGDAVQHLERSADLKSMRQRNLARFCAADYIAELQPLYMECFGTSMVVVENDGGWI